MFFDICQSVINLIKTVESLFDPGFYAEDNKRKYEPYNRKKKTSHPDYYDESAEKFHTSISLYNNTEVITAGLSLGKKNRGLWILLRSGGEASEKKVYSREKGVYSYAK